MWCCVHFVYNTLTVTIAHLWIELFFFAFYCGVQLQQRNIKDECHQIETLWDVNFLKKRRPTQKILLAFFSSSLFLSLSGNMKHFLRRGDCKVSKKMLISSIMLTGLNFLIFAIFGEFTILKIGAKCVVENVIFTFIIIYICVVLWSSQRKINIQFLSLLFAEFKRL